eukprot:GHUV01055354.1.p1 GENE.GHUV01055354.1~~GHUV01055354.1.p1  ORF type:complete len:493 (+),score=165.50 GHUV01055354.1:717-2195(+)
MSCNAVWSAKNVSAGAWIQFCVCLMQCRLPGAQVVGSIKAGLTLQQQFESFLDAGHDCRSNGVNGRLRQVLKTQLRKCLPEDAALRCSDGTCWISITQVIPRPCNKLYGGFSDKQALIRALLASCHLPRISDGGLFTYYKSPHKRVFDGGFSNLIPVPPAPPPAFTTPSMSAELPLDHNSSSSDGGGSSKAGSSAAPTPSQRAAVSGSDARDSPAAETVSQGAAAVTQAAAAAAAATQERHSSSLKGIRLGFGAARHHSSSSGHGHLRIGSHKSHSSGSRLFRRSKSAPDHSAAAAAAAVISSSSTAASEQAFDNASCLVSSTGAYIAPSAAGWFSVRVSVLPAKHMQQMPAMFNAPTAEGVAIAPDKYQEWPHDLDTTTKLALYPQDDVFLWDLFERGRADGLSWARDVGFPAEVLQKVEGLTSDSDQLPSSLRVVREQLQQQQQGDVKGAKHKQKEQETAELAAVGDAEARAAVSIAATATGAAGTVTDT